MGNSFLLNLVCTTFRQKLLVEAPFLEVGLIIRRFLPCLDVIVDALVCLEVWDSVTSIRESILCILYIQRSYITVR